MLPLTADREALVQQADEVVKRGKPEAPEPNRSLDAIRAAVDGAGAEELGALQAAELDLADASGNSALIWAADRGNLDAVTFLCRDELVAPGEGGAPPRVDLARRGFLGCTAVARAATRDHDAVLRVLLDAAQRALPGGAAALAGVPNVKLQYPLHYAGFHSRVKALEVLLEPKYAVDTRVKDRKGRTPLEDTADSEVKSMISAARAREGGQQSGAAHA